MAIDPICGMTVDEATASSAERDGQTFYFCSEHCRNKFLDAGLPVETQHDPTHCESVHQAPQRTFSSPLSTMPWACRLPREFFIPSLACCSIR